MKRLAALLLPLLLLTTYAQAQSWALPAPTPNTDVLCMTCPGAAQDKPTIGYSGAIRTFTGRFCDSQFTQDWQSPLRTARADAVKLAPGRNRVYVQLGSALFSYDYSTFFTKLKAGDMVSAASVLESKRLLGATETLLRYDTFFNAEWSHSGWITPRQDGQERLYDFDFDDRNLLYLTTASYFGWGIVRDNTALHDGSLMESVHQEYPPVSPDIFRLAVLKQGARYYLVGSSGNSHSAQLWDVTIPEAPLRLPDLPRGFKRIARTDDMARFATLDDNGRVVINSIQQLGTGGSYGTFRATSGTGFGDVTSDGTNFYAVWSTPALDMMVTAFIYDPAADSYTAKNMPVGGEHFDASNGTITAGAGYLSIVGQGEQGFDMRLLKVDRTGFTVTDVPLNNYIARYYTSPPAGYVAPGTFIQLRSGLVMQQGVNTYLAVNAHALGDVYLIEGDDLPPACLTLDASRVAPVYSGVTPECNPGAANASCHFNEQVTFDAAAIGGYKFNCAAHTFKWTLPDHSVINTKAFTKIFGAPGDYNVMLEVTTPTAHLSRSVTVHVSPTPVPDPGCQTLTPANVSYDYTNPSATCGPSGGQCGSGDAITFRVTGRQGYNFNCGTHTFRWTIGGTVASLQPTFTRTFATPGDYPVRLTVTNPVSSVDLDFTLHVANIIPPACLPLTTSTVSYDYSNTVNTCSPFGGLCSANDPIAFRVAAFGGYDLSCAPHTFTWTAGDTVLSRDAAFVRSFPAAGDYPMTLTVNNGTAALALNFTVHVVPGAAPKPRRRPGGR